MRREADDTGPMAELEHWKMRMAKFSSLVEQINHEDCRAVLRILHIAKSKTLKVIFSSFKPTLRLYKFTLVDTCSDPREDEHELNSEG